MRKTLILPLMLLSTLLLPSKAFGHAVETNYAFSSEFVSKLELKSTYSSGEPLQKAQVLVYAPNNPSEPWLETVTDDEGKFSFTPDASIPGDWQIEIHKEGHEDYLTIPVSKKGINVEHISDTGHQDIHYGSIPLNPFSMIILGGGVAGGLFFWHRHKKSIE